LSEYNDSEQINYAEMVAQTETWTDRHINRQTDTFECRPSAKVKSVGP